MLWWQVWFIALLIEMADQRDFKLLSLGMRRIGWIRFWIQTILGVVVVGVLVISNASSLAKEAESRMGLGPGLSVTTLSFILLLFSLWQSWLIVKTGRALDSEARPSRGETSRLIKRGLIADLLGLVFAVIGYQALAGALFIQASMQTRSGFSSGMRGLQDYSITPLETLSVLSNSQVLFAHFFGLLLSLWLLQRVFRKK